MMIDKGADVNKWKSHKIIGEICSISLILIKIFFSQWGKSPLEAAFQGGYTETAKLLIDKGADMNKHDEVTGTHGHFILQFLSRCCSTLL